MAVTVEDVVLPVPGMPLKLLAGQEQPVDGCTCPSSEDPTPWLKGSEQLQRHARHGDDVLDGDGHGSIVRNV